MKPFLVISSLVVGVAVLVSALVLGSACGGGGEKQQLEAREATSTPVPVPTPDRCGRASRLIEQARSGDKNAMLQLVNYPDCPEIWAYALERKEKVAEALLAEHPGLPVDLRQLLKPVLVEYIWAETPEERQEAMDRMSDLVRSYVAAHPPIIAQPQPPVVVEELRPGRDLTLELQQLEWRLQELEAEQGLWAD